MKFAALSDLLTRDLDRSLHYALLCGLDSIELRMIGSGRVPDVNEDKLRRRLLETELDAAAIVPGIFEGGVTDLAAWMNEIVELPDTISFCTRINCPTIVVSAFHDADDAGDPARAVEPIRKLSDAVRKAGLQIAVVNEPDSLAPTAGKLTELIDAVDRPNVGAAWSPATSFKAGENVEVAALRIRDRLMIVRCSDVRKTGAGAWHQTPFGEGEVEWKRILGILGEGFDGVFSFEAYAEPAAKQGLRDATWLIRTWREAARR